MSNEGARFFYLGFWWCWRRLFSQDRDEGRGFRVFFLLAAGARLSGAGSRERVSWRWRRRILDVRCQALEVPVGDDFFIALCAFYKCGGAATIQVLFGRKASGGRFSVPRHAG